MISSLTCATFSKPYLLVLLEQLFSMLQKVRNKDLKSVLQANCSGLNMTP